MKNPTDRMLIDALAIVMAERAGLLDIQKIEGVTQFEAFNIVCRAKEIIGHYAPLAIQRIKAAIDEERQVIG